MTSQEYIDKAEANLIHTYNRYQIVLDKGDGVYLYDVDGNKYLDFTSGHIAVDIYDDQYYVCCSFRAVRTIK